MNKKYFPHSSYHHQATLMFPILLLEHKSQILYLQSFFENKRGYLKIKVYLVTYKLQHKNLLFFSPTIIEINKG